jgi:hypothetical protein
MPFDPSILITLLINAVIAVLLYFLVASGYYYFTPEAQIPDWWPDKLKTFIRPPTPKRTYNIVSEYLAPSLSSEPRSFTVDYAIQHIDEYFKNLRIISNVTDLNTCEAYCFSNTNCTAFTYEGNKSCTLVLHDIAYFVATQSNIVSSNNFVYSKQTPPSYQKFESNTFNGDMTTSTSFAANCFCTDCAGVVFDFTSNVCSKYSNISTVSTVANSNIVALKLLSNVYTKTVSFG